ncbi:hypothetical protein HanIR_Chr13g0649141 [Helianthus annuus]|nr:hypothetical protein HanIR_Chr13g0649141 [Helianthus annuus]
MKVNYPSTYSPNHLGFEFSQIEGKLFLCPKSIVDVKQVAWVSFKLICGVLNTILCVLKHAYFS